MTRDEFFPFAQHWKVAYSADLPIAESIYALGGNNTISSELRRKFSRERLVADESRCAIPTPELEGAPAKTSKGRRGIEGLNAATKANLDLIPSRPNVARWYKDINERPSWQAVKDGA
ncbi:hypothetical protein B0H13DRAFT_1865970 [Mycena leptocephala]|nr:hypothetical protein B0H13DRAFT_1865970 [Mycena leptocephala]